MTIHTHIWPNKPVFLRHNQAPRTGHAWLRWKLQAIYGKVTRLKLDMIAGTGQDRAEAKSRFRNHLLSIFGSHDPVTHRITASYRPSRTGVNHHDAFIHAQRHEPMILDKVARRHIEQSSEY